MLVNQCITLFIFTVRFIIFTIYMNLSLSITRLSGLGKRAHTGSKKSENNLEAVNTGRPVIIIYNKVCGLRSDIRV